MTENAAEFEKRATVAASFPADGWGQTSAIAVSGSNAP